MGPSEVASGASASAGVEVEWQFDALDLRPVERWLAALGTSSARASAPLPPPLASITAVAQRARRQVDVYLDTEDWRVRRAGYVLRVRKRPGGVEATLKDTAPAASGLRRRIEVTEQLSAKGLDSLDGEGPVRTRLRALCGRQPLAPVLEVRTFRHPYDLLAGDERLAEVALDDTVVAVGTEQPLRLRRVEVEVMAGRAEDLTPLVERMGRDNGLWPATLSKFEAGVMAAGLQIPALPDVGPTSIPEEPTVGDVAYAVLRRNALAMLAHEPGTRLGEDPEELHDMRVATRRLRAGLQLFAGALPVNAQRVRNELGWLGGLLGAVRDLDVELEQLGEWRAEVGPEDRDALGDLVAIVEQHRQEGRRALLAGLETARYRRLVSGLVSMLQKGPSRRLPAGRTLAVAAAPELVESRQKAAAKAAKRAKRTGIPSDFHRLRIRCKRLRYALEFVSEVYEHKTAGFVRQLVGLQDALGLLQDAEVAGARLRTQVEEGGSSLKARTVFAMGIAAERHHAQAERLLSSLPGQVKVLKGSRWRKLQGLMEQRRTEAALSVRPSSVRLARPTGPRPATPDGAPGDGRIERAAAPSDRPARQPRGRDPVGHRFTSSLVSADGTTIAFDEKGEGPALILVDGALSARTSESKAALVDLLAPRLRVYRFDRRGRGDSGDTPPYAVEREIEDIEALIDHAGGSAFLYGHSSGACLVLEAALRLGPKATKLALYEAPYEDDPADQPAWATYLHQLDEALASNRRGDAVALFMAYVGTPPDQVAAMRRTPSWPQLEAVAPTLAYDHTGILGPSRAVPATRLASVEVPTLIMCGGAGAPYMAETARTLSRVVPGAELRVLEGQTHAVQPAALAPVLVEFLLG